MVSTFSDQQRGVTLGLLTGAWLMMVVPVAAAQAIDTRWAPWIGCWRAVEATATEPLLCVVPLADEAAIEMLTVVDGQVVSRESIFTDGQQHAVSRNGCEGWEEAEFSVDSRRIYVRSELTCGAGPHRSSTGVMSMVSPFEWLDVRTMDVDGQSVPWALRYRLASQADFEAAGQGNLFAAQASEARVARMVASRPIVIADVVEATGKLSAETVELWLAERGEPFPLDASRLVEMADAGVPPSVIDVVVAVSYPEKFVLNGGWASGRRSAEAEGGPSSLGYGRSFNPFVDPFYEPYSRYGYGYYPRYGSRWGYSLGYYNGFGYGPGYYGGFGYGYSGYGFGGYNYGFGGYGNRIIVVGRSGSGGGSGYSEGRVVRGGGYTSAGNSGGNTGRSAQPRSSRSSRTAAPAARSARSRSAAPARSSAPRSSPRSSGGSRSAQPRAGRGR
ncbi:MAG: hypothetical protein IIC36_01125 [Gemmatimonadetes bacterium]|nr:hypothetical protein [Gemmatimonadota bacterium]